MQSRASLVMQGRLKSPRIRKRAQTRRDQASPCVRCAVDSCREHRLQRDVRDQLAPLWAFALTFDGYTYFGGDEEATSRLGEFAESVRRAYVRDGRVPALGEIGLLRACLFYEQRNWCKWGKVLAEITREDAQYFVSLAEAIRARLR
jgi:hypothetical protein